VAVVSNISARLRSVGRRLASINRPALFAGLVLAGLVAAGAAWLAGSWRTETWLAVPAGPLAADELVAATEALDSRGIGYCLRDGRLLVPAGDVLRARQVLATSRLPAGDEAESFEQLANEDDLWRTRQQSEKRWQAAKMRSLSRLISGFPSVRSATVIFEPGKPGRLGRPAVAPTAAVTVCLEARSRMTGRLVAAIADLVSGSVAGMDRQDVRIVDNRGRSYSVGEAGAPEPPEDAEQRCAEKVQELLAYIEGAVVAVNVRADGPPGRRMSVSVAVPRSHLIGIQRAAGQAEGADGWRLHALAAAELARIQQSVAHLIGADDPTAVRVDWYYDAVAAAAPAPQPATEDRPGASLDASVLRGLAFGGACLLLAFSTLVSRRRTRRIAGATLLARPVPATAGRPGEGDAGSGEEPPSSALLAGLTAEDVFAAVGEEHPQTIALAVSRLDPAKAAALLRMLTAEAQAEVVHRLAGIEQTDAQVMQELERGLSARLAEFKGAGDARARHAAKAAEILQHAGYGTERAVLDGLGRRDPQLAESIRNRMFEFEDIGRLSTGEVRAAIAGVDSGELAVALRTASRKVSKRIFAGLSATRARRLRQEMEQIGPVRLSDVEAAQRQVVEAIRQAQDGRYVNDFQPTGSGL